MVPFVMRDLGEVRRQELLAAIANVELLERLPPGGNERSAAGVWRSIGVAISTFFHFQGQSRNRRYRHAVGMVGVRR
jgi:hypothetical protein